MSIDTFIDSNIFVYLFDPASPNKRYRAEKLIADALQKGNVCISYQVIQETLNVITTKLQVNATAEQANKFLLDALVPLWKINPTRELYLRSLSIQSRYRYSFYDSLIIAAALEAGCKTLYSEDMQHGQRIEQLIIKNPFLE